MPGKLSVWKRIGCIDPGGVIASRRATVRENTGLPWFENCKTGFCCSCCRKRWRGRMPNGCNGGLGRASERQIGSVDPASVTWRQVVAVGERKVVLRSRLHCAILSGCTFRALSRISLKRIDSGSEERGLPENALVPRSGRACRQESELKSRGHLEPFSFGERSQP